MSNSLYNNTQSNNINGVNAEYCEKLIWSTMQGYDLFTATLTMHPTTNPLTSTPWNWTNYFTYLSYTGFQGINEFNNLFPVPSRDYNMFINYRLKGNYIFNP